MHSMARGGFVAQAIVPEQISLDPVDLKQLLAKLIISDVERDQFRIRYRLVGTNVVSAARLDLTGRYLIAYDLSLGISPIVAIKTFLADFLLCRCNQFVRANRVHHCS